MSDDRSQGPRGRARVSGPTRLVRPGWSWSGLVALVLGMAAVGGAIVVDVVTLALIGAVLLLVGAICAVRGGLLFDVDTTLGAEREITGVEGAGPREAPTARAHLEDAAAQQTARAANERTRRLLAAAGSVPRPPLGPVGVLLVLLVCLWLLLSQGTLIPGTAVGRLTGIRDLTIAVIVALAAFRLCAGFSRGALGVCVVAGVVLVLSGLLLDHDAQRSAVNEVGSGIVVVVASLLTLDRGGAAGSARDARPRR